jgi:hypothetical protein
VTLDAPHHVSHCEVSHGKRKVAPSLTKAGSWGVATFYDLPGIPLSHRGGDGPRVEDPCGGGLEHGAEGLLAASGAITRGQGRTGGGAVEGGLVEKGLAWQARPFPTHYTTTLTNHW